MKSKDRGDKKNYILAGLILVLTISVGYLGISNVKDTYAVDVCPSGYSLVNSGKSCCPTGDTYKDGYCISNWNKPFSTTYDVSKDSSGNINCTHTYSNTFKLDLPILVDNYGYDTCGCVAGTLNAVTQECDATCTKNKCGVKAISANKQCYHCTGQASNGNYYQWATQPEGTCSGGSWRILNNVTNSQNCKASTVTYKCFHCTGQASNGNYYQWTTQPEGTCSGGSWITLDKVTSSSSCNATTSCAYTTKSSCESANSGYNCVADSKGCYVKGTAKSTCAYITKNSCESANKGYNCVADSKGCYVKGTAKSTCTYITKNSCESANKGYSCVANGSDDYGNTCYKIANNITYTIKFNANEGTGTTKEVKCTYGSDCTLTANAFIREGYKFNGWNTKNDGSGLSYADKAIVKDLSSTDGATITLYAKWKLNNAELNTHKIIFVHNDGIQTSTTLTIDDNDTAPVITPTRDGFTFDGWYTDSELTKKYDFTTQVKDDFTLYAKWNDNNSSKDKTDEEITKNSKTGDVLMFIAWTIGFGALAFSVYYYKTRKETL